MIRSLLVLLFLFVGSTVLLPAQVSGDSADTSQVTEQKQTEQEAVPVISKVLTPAMLMQPKQTGPNDMPAAFSYNELGFFCKMEYQIQRKIPLMIRLGEVKCTEKMEGKGQSFPQAPAQTSTPTK